MLPFQLIYGAEVVFTASLGVPVMRLLQEQHNEPNHMQRRINQIIELNELRDKAYHKVQIHQENMKNTFDKKVKEEQFLKWDAPHEDKGKNWKFDNM